MGKITIRVDINLSSEDDSATDADFDRAEASLDCLPRILSETVGARCRQDMQHGGAEHDDTHTPKDWEELIDEHASRLTGGDGIQAADYRDRLIEIAALACAAAQAWDRSQRNGRA